MLFKTIFCIYKRKKFNFSLAGMEIVQWQLINWIETPRTTSLTTSYSYIVCLTAQYAVCKLPYGRTTPQPSILHRNRVKRKIFQWDPRVPWIIYRLVHIPHFGPVAGPSVHRCESAKRPPPSLPFPGWISGWWVRPPVREYKWLRRWDGRSGPLTQHTRLPTTSAWHIGSLAPAFRVVAHCKKSLRWKQQK